MLLIEMNKKINQNTSTKNAITKIECVQKLSKQILKKGTKSAGWCKYQKA